MAASPWAFFRGAPLLHHRDLAGTDGSMPAVLTSGDITPESFGILPGTGETPLFTLDDLGEVCVAPFTADVHRGAVGFWLAAVAAGGREKSARGAVSEWLDGYIETVAALATGGEAGRITSDSEAAVLAPQFAKAGRPRADYLAKRVDDSGARLREDGRTLRDEAVVDEMAAAVAQYAASVAGAERPEEFFTVQDVAIRDGGSASEGRPRYWVLVHGWGPSREESVILEVCPTVPCAAQGLVPTYAADPAVTDRARTAHEAFRRQGDPLYGHLELGGARYVVRERSPHRIPARVDRFDKRQLRDYARLCGGVLAQVHACSDVFGAADGSRPEARIAHAVAAPAFRDDVLELAEELAARVDTDQKLFLDDLARGAFTP